MKVWFIIFLISAISWLSIWYVLAHKEYPKLSSYIDTKAIHGVKPSWVVTMRTHCSWTCSNSSSSSSYSSSSSRWGYGWGGK